MSGPTSVDPAGVQRPAPASGSLEQEIDRISLSQALLDADIATSRVVDLTRRLVEAGDHIAQLQGEVAALRGRIAELEGQVAAAQEEVANIVSTKAFRIADRLWAIRRAVRG